MKNRPELEHTTGVINACGMNLNSFGEAEFTLTFGDLVIRQNIIVANIDDECLLGVDVLQNKQGVAADIILSQGILKLQGVDIPCIQIESNNKCRRVTAADDYTIPPYSEKIIQAFVEREDVISEPTEFIIEPNENFSSRYELLMASTLVDTAKSTSIPIRILNPTCDEKQIRQDAVLGIADEFLYETVFDDDCQNDTPPISVRCSAEKESTENIKIPEHLVQMYENSLKDNNFDQTSQKLLLDLLLEYQDAFSKNDLDLGLTHVSEHIIDTGDAKPIKLPPRRVPIAYAEAELQTINDMEKQGIIRKSNSPWASPLNLVLKKNGKIRPCVDYRRVNDVTINDAFPLPRIQDCLDAVSGATIFSTFDLTSGYHQVPVRESDIPKTAFITKYGLWEFLTMPMGMKGSAQTFQRTLQMILNGLQWQTCLIYLDDIIVFGSNFQEHLNRVKEVLERIRKAGLKLKPNKCQLFQKEVSFLGHVINKNGITPNPDNIAKIIDWPIPKTPTEVRQIIGMVSYYRKFIKDFASIVRPLVNLTKKDITFNWTTDCQDAFQKIKELLTGPEIMSFPIMEGEFVLDTDASNYSIGAVLSQVQDGQEKVIAYASRALNKAEINYCVTDKELLAVRYFVEYFRQYLLGRRFKIRTDHQALVWLFKIKEPKGRIARWIEILSSYDFSIEYRPGNKHGNADALSRCPNPKDCQCSNFDNLEPLKCGPCKMY